VEFPWIAFDTSLYGDDFDSIQILLKIIIKLNFFKKIKIGLNQLILVRFFYLVWFFCLAQFWLSFF
jgi:hypothetical protein